MIRHAPLVGIVTATTFWMALAGCRPQEPFYTKQVHDDEAYYKGIATEIEVPDVESDRLPDASNAERPLSLQNRNTKEVWDLTLEEAIRIALTNNKVMRNIGGQVQGSPEFLLRNPEAAPTVYDVALAESNPRTGPEAALSAFDAQWTTSVTWEKYDTPQNYSESYAALYPTVLQQDTATLQTKLSKVTATGGTFALSHVAAYVLNNQPSRLYNSDWNVKLVAEMRQPLLQGAGVQFNRIAGPGATPGMYNGVMLARINTDIALAEFESSVRNLVSDVETAYWELHFQYRSLDAVIAGRDSALTTWRRIYTLYVLGSKGGEAEKEAQARGQYFLFRSTAEQSLSALYATEAKLRYLLGLASTDGRLIRPADEPTTAKVSFDWRDVLSEGLARNVELREEKWIVKRRELELIAAKNFLLPKLDLVAQYRWLGFGNRIDGSGIWDADNLDADLDTNAYRSLTSGRYQEWETGFVLNVPLGFRRELAGVRNAQLALAKERAKLQEGELELSHQLAYAIRDMETNYVLSQTNFNRRIAAQREVEAVTAAYETDTVTIDRVLEAQQKLAQAESQYYRSLVDYNKSILGVHYRKGSLLEYNGVYLAEGPWPAKAYFDARRRAHEREASTYLDYGFTQPRVISRGPLEQNAGEGTGSEGSAAEVVPTPTPTGASLTPVPETGSTSDGNVPSDAVPALPAAPRPSVEEGSNHESGENPPAPPVDRSTSGWQGLQR